MANPIRQNVFTDSLDDLVRGFLFRPVSVDGSNAPQFKMDVFENEIAYRVRADLPGVKKEDIFVSIEGNAVTISAEVRDHDVDNGDRVLRSERYAGKLMRSFSLAEDIEDGGAEARYVDGVLEVMLPKKSATKGKRVVIS